VSSQRTGLDLTTGARPLAGAIDDLTAERDALRPQCRGFLRSTTRGAESAIGNALCGMLHLSPPPATATSVRHRFLLGRGMVSATADRRERMFIQAVSLWEAGMCAPRSMSTARRCSAGRTICCR
jgi:hypothetical protein